MPSSIAVQSSLPSSHAARRALWGLENTTPSPSSPSKLKVRTFKKKIFLSSKCSKCIFLPPSETGDTHTPVSDQAPGGLPPYSPASGMLCRFSERRSPFNRSVSCSEPSFPLAPSGRSPVRNLFDPYIFCSHLSGHNFAQIHTTLGAHLNTCWVQSL